jgi:hypothetical protein
VCDVLSGADDFEEMENYGKQKEAFCNCLALVSIDVGPAKKRAFGSSLREKIAENITGKGGHYVLTYLLP